jgi:hypothetical protein
MKTSTRISIALFAILSLGVAAASAADVPSGLSAHISAATNRVSTLRSLEFTVVLTNSGPTNVTIYPRIFIHGEQTIAVFNPQGRFLVQKPKSISLSDMEPMERVLKSGETFTFTNTLSDETIPPTDGNPGKYHARFGGHTPSNEVEITVE